VRPSPPVFVRQVLLGLVLLFTVLSGGVWAGGSPAVAAPDDTMLTVPATEQPATEQPEPAPGAPSGTDNDFVDLERDLSECVGNSVSKPGCGREPTHSGDRGSAMQWTIFGLMAAGIAFIGWRIVSGARRSRAA
jgi:hypothetical protein